MTRETMLKRITEDWRPLMVDVHYSFTGIAKEAGMAADNVQRIMEGTHDNPGTKTVQRIKDAIERLRNTCPYCHRDGLKEALRERANRRPEA